MRVLKLKIALFSLNKLKTALCAGSPSYDVLDRSKGVRPGSNGEKVERCSIKVNASSITPDDVRDRGINAWRSLTAYDSDSFVGISEDGQKLFKLYLSETTSYQNKYNVMGKGPNQGLMKIEDCGDNADSVLARFFLLTTDCVYLSSNEKLQKYIGSCKDAITPATTHSRYASITGAITKIIVRKETLITSISYHSGRLFLMMKAGIKWIIVFVQINDSSVTGTEIKLEKEDGAIKAIQTRLFFEAGESAVYFTLWGGGGHLVTKVPVNAIISREINEFTLNVIQPLDRGVKNKIPTHRDSIVGMSYWKYDMLILLTNDGKLHVYDPQQSDYQHDSSESTKRWSAFGMTAEEYDHEVPNYEVNYKSEWANLSCIALNGDELAALSANRGGKAFPLWLQLDSDVTIAKPSPRVVGSKLLWFNELNFINTTEVKVCPTTGGDKCITNTRNPNKEEFLDLFDRKYFFKGQDSFKITLRNIGRYGKEISAPFRYTIMNRIPLHIDLLEDKVSFLIDTLTFAVNSEYNAEPINHFVVECTNANNACPPEEDRIILSTSGAQGVNVRYPEISLYATEGITASEHPLLTNGKSVEDYQYFTYYFDLLAHGFLPKESYEISITAVSDNYRTTITKEKSEDNNLTFVPVSYVTDFQFTIYNSDTFLANVTVNKVHLGTELAPCHLNTEIVGIGIYPKAYPKTCHCRPNSSWCYFTDELRGGETFSEFVSYRVTLRVYRETTIHPIIRKYYHVQKDKPTLEDGETLPVTEEPVTVETVVEASIIGIVITIVIISLLLVCGFGNFYIYHQGLFWFKPSYKKQKSRGRHVAKATKEAKKHPPVQQIHPLNVADEEYYQKNVYDIYNTKFGPLVPALAGQEEHRGVGDEEESKKVRTGKKKRSAGTGGKYEEMHLKQVFDFRKKVSDVREAANMPVPGVIASGRPAYDGVNFDEGAAYDGMRKDIAK